MPADRMTMARARLALREAAQGWLFDPNVTLVDFGYPIHDGLLAQDELAIRIHVKEKLSGFALEDASETGLTRPIPDHIGEFPTDVPQGTYRPNQWWSSGRQPRTDPRAARANPLLGGISISDEYHNTYGTLGGKVIDRTTGAEMLLSNWHVLVGDWWPRPHRSIFQPGRLDGGTYGDVVATLARDAMDANLDAAVAVLNGQRPCINYQFEMGPVGGVGDAYLGMEVVKSGRTTHITRGRVAALAGVAKIPYAGLDRIIRNVVTIEPHSPFEDVSAGGDSGSWWLSADSVQAIGLHFAGSNQPERALAIDMRSVLDALNVEIVAGG